MVKKNLDLFGRMNMRDIANQFLQQYEGGISILDPRDNYKFIEINQYALNMTGYSQFEVIGQPLSKFIKQEQDCKELYNSLDSKKMFRKTFKHTRKNGSTFWMEFCNMPLYDDNGELGCYLIFTNDKTEEYNAESLIILEREVYTALELGIDQITVFEQMANHISTTLQKGSQCSFLLFNDEQLLDEMPGNMPKCIKQIMYPMEQKRYIEKIVKEAKGNYSCIITNLKEDSFWKDHLDLIEKNNYQTFWCESIFDQDGEVIGQYNLYFKQPLYIDKADIAYLHKISSIVSLVLKYYKQRKEIYRLAYFDSGTGLSNINLFKAKLQQQFLKYVDGGLFILMPTEYDQIVDVFGSERGDILIKQLATRVQTHFSSDDVIVARYMNSAVIFAVPPDLLESVKQKNCIESLAKEPFFINERQISITLKAGKTIITSDETADELVQHADIALSFALKDGGNIVKLFTPTLQSILTDEIDVLSHLSTAFNKHEFIPMLQPKVDLRTKEIVGFEALARWNSEELGFISPAMFIPVAESTGSVYKIDRQVLRHVLQWQRKRMLEGKRLYAVSVNISASHFYYPTFVENCMELINAYGIDTRYICFEITESIELENIGFARDIISRLNDYGIRTSIDDFGKGYSSLSYLQQLNFREIKIDKSFIDDIEQVKMKAVVKGIIHLAEAVEMISVAEGIETKEQYEVLKEIGCQVAQGFYFYKPMSFEQIEKIIDGEQ